MNLTLGGAEQLATELRRTLGSHRSAEIVVFPSFPFLAPVVSRCGGSAIGVGAQDLHPKSCGAFTSGVSAEMIRSLGCQRVLLGHSERRAWFRDSDELVAEKVERCLGEGLLATLCVGESLQQRQSEGTNEFLVRQLESALERHSAAALSELVVAYEPVWAIGTGVSATPEQAEQTHAFIRSHLAGHFGDAFADRLRIQYGGSVKATNAGALMACPNIDGLLVGGASLDAVEFRRIVYAASRR